MPKLDVRYNPLDHLKNRDIAFEAYGRNYPIPWKEFAETGVPLPEGEFEWKLARIKSWEELDSWVRNRTRGKRSLCMHCKKGVVSFTNRHSCDNCGIDRKNTHQVAQREYRKRG